MKKVTVRNCCMLLIFMLLFACDSGGGGQGTIVQLESDEANTSPVLIVRNLSISSNNVSIPFSASDPDIEDVLTLIISQTAGPSGVNVGEINVKEGYAHVNFSESGVYSFDLVLADGKAQTTQNITVTVDIDNVISGVIEKGGLLQQGVIVELFDIRNSSSMPIASTQSNAEGEFFFSIPGSPNNYSVKVSN